VQGCDGVASANAGWNTRNRLAVWPANVSPPGLRSGRWRVKGPELRAARDDQTGRPAKTKHQRTAVFPVVGWRPSTPFRLGGLILAEDSEPIGTAALALPEADGTALVNLMERHGRTHPTGAITFPEDCLSATVRFTSRTPPHGPLREAVVVAVHPQQQLNQEMIRKHRPGITVNASA
jgi:hypothetical protein